MRSEQIHKILLLEENRFQICGLLSRYLKLRHIPGTRVGESIGGAITQLCVTPSISCRLSRTELSGQRMPAVIARQRQTMSKFDQSS